jgi:putative ABC transport system permease protein
MINNYLTVIFRSFWRYRLYSLLNVLGLAIALAVAMLIFLYVKREISYDRHFEKADRIFRVVNYNFNTERARNWANGPPLLAEEITGFIPEIENVTRMRPIPEAVLEYVPDSLNRISHMDYGGFFVDSGFIEIFDVHMTAGDIRNPLKDPGSIVLTQSLAQKFFGEEDPVGKSILMRGFPLAITAVCEDFPETQHFSPSYFIDWQSFVNLMSGLNMRDLYYDRGWAGVYTYVLLEEHIRAADLDEKMVEFRVDFFRDFGSREKIIETGQFLLQPLTEIHLKSHLEQEVEANGNIVYVVVSTLAAIFILLIAGVNYVNLATVKTFKRIREVGIRKVNGAQKYQLAFQFIGESLMMALISGILSVLLMDILLPLFNRITGNHFETIEIIAWQHTALLLILVLLLGLISGLYPALFASGTSPINALKEMKDPGSLTNRVRVGLVVMQFMVSIFMIFGTLIVYRQMDFFLHTDIGFKKEHVMALSLNGGVYAFAQENPDLFKEEMSQLAFVKNASLVGTLPGDRFSLEALFPEVPREEDNNPSIRFLRVDEDFIPLMNIELVEGRNLSRPGDSLSEFILNEAAVRALRLRDPVNVKATSFFGQQGEIVGVSRDFHYASLHDKIEPLVLEVNYDREFRNLFYQYLLLRVIPGDLAGMVDIIEEKMQGLAEEYVLDFTLLEDNLHKNYSSEERLKELLQAFALFAIFISCLGLFGLSAFSAELRTKEMGIRKAMGASLLKIAAQLSRNFVFYVIFALVLALPLGYYFMGNWLDNFAFHIEIEGWEFILTAGLALLITLVSVGYQAFRSGITNPVDALRYE